jgi:hypothetical protein
MADGSLALARAVGIWLMLVAVELIHGLMRRLFLEPQLGDLRAGQISVFTGAVLIMLVFRFTLTWLGPQPVRRWRTFGLFWLAPTLAFEIGVGRATGMSWERIASDFDPRRGGLLAFGMLVILVAPRLWAQRRGLIQDGHGRWTNGWSARRTRRWRPAPALRSETRLQNVSTTSGESRGFGWTAVNETKQPNRL